MHGLDGREIIEVEDKEERVGEKKTYGDSGAVFADSARENSSKVVGEHEQVNSSCDSKGNHFDFNFDPRNLMVPGGVQWASDAAAGGENGIRSC